MKTRIIQDDSTSGRPASRWSPGGSSGAGGQVETQPRAVVALLRRHPLLTFFVLAYAIAWCLLPFGTFLPLGPLVAAVVVISITEGRNGLRQWGARMTRWRVGWFWYACAIGIPLLVHAAAVTGNRLAGAPAPSWSQFTPWYSVPMLLALALVNPVNGPLGEEPGWRAYAQPGLQSRRSPLLATGILAVLVTGWHLPLVLMPQFDLGLPDLVTTFAVTFWYGWLFNRSGASALLTLIAHATEGSIDTSSFWPAGADAAREQWACLLAWVTVVAALLLLDREAWRKGPGEGGSLE